jgi:hypothetical protein
MLAGQLRAVIESKDMTLTVSAYARTAQGDMLTFDPAETDSPRNDLFGFEVCRKELWGAQVMETLGLEILPSLTTHNIYAEQAELDQLETEAQTVFQNLALIADRTLYSTDFIAFRIMNLVWAINKARSLAEQYQVVGVMVS